MSHTSTNLKFYHFMNWNYLSLKDYVPNLGMSLATVLGTLDCMIVMARNYIVTVSISHAVDGKLHGSAQHRCDSVSCLQRKKGIAIYWLDFISGTSATIDKIIKFERTLFKQVEILSIIYLLGI